MQTALADITVENDGAGLTRPLRRLDALRPRCDGRDALGVGALHVAIAPTTRTTAAVATADLRGVV
jgi:hypothetical protein